MKDTRIHRREFVAGGAATLAGAAAGAEAAPRSPILNFNPRMEYRRLGKTGLMVSAVAMGGHWKRVNTALPIPFEGSGYARQDFDNVNLPEFIRNRHEVVSHAIEAGINYIDACTGPEVLAYSKVLKGRRDKMYLGFSWFQREPRYAERRSRAKLLEGLDQSFREAGLDYVDLWRVTLPEQNSEDISEIKRIEEATMEALAAAKKAGKTRFCGISTHNRAWLNWMVTQYHDTLDVVLFPYTPATRELPTDSVFDAVKKYDVGIFGIKPFGSNALFQGDGSLRSPHREEDDRRARLAIRYVLGNPAVTAPIPGLASVHHVDNAALAVVERRKLDLKEKADLNRAATEMWARLHPSYNWLRDWQEV